MPYLFRNYNLPADVTSSFPGSCKYSLWEALRATTAAPGWGIGVIVTIASVYRPYCLFLSTIYYYCFCFIVDISLFVYRRMCYPWHLWLYFFLVLLLFNILKSLSHNTQILWRDYFGWIGPPRWRHFMQQSHRDRFVNTVIWIWLRNKKYVASWRAAIHEARRIWGHSAPIECIISLGTGVWELL